MNNKRNFNLVKAGIAGVSIAVLALMSGCGKDVECDVKEDHIHLYNNSDKGLCKYILGEKQEVWGYLRTDHYKKLTEELKIASQHNLCSIEDNKSYFQKEVNNKPANEREEHVNETKYGTYYGYGYGYNISEGDFSYDYGLKYGAHNEDYWKSINLDEYTNNPVHDITYTIKLYKIVDGYKVESKEFDSIEEIDPNYKYFKEDNLIVKNVGNTYHLQGKKTK